MFGWADGPAGQTAYLSNSIVDLVSACVIEVFALEINIRASIVLRETLCKVQGRLAPDIVLQTKRRHIHSSNIRPLPAVRNTRKYTLTLSRALRLC